MKNIKCTYDRCFRRFKTEEDMRKHKAKEPAHDYCKRCDKDCVDDLDYLIHQISSPAHICCPVDGLEFESKSGRDAHVEQSHPQKQNLNCVGCDEKFTKAAALMSHIEKDECKVIRLEIFERQRAEKQIAKDAWESVTGSFAISSLQSLHGGSQADSNDGGVSLLDDIARYITRDWEGNTISSLSAPLWPITRSGYKAPRPTIEGSGDLSASMSNLTLDKYPVLPSRSKNNTRDSNGELLDLNQPEQRIQQYKAAGQWAATELVGRTLFPQAKTAAPVNSTTNSQIGPIDNMSELSTATKGTNATNQTNWTFKSLNKTTTVPLQSVASTSQNAHLTTSVRVQPPSTVDPNTYFHPLLQAYVCPGSTCGRQFPTPEAFSAHLLTSAHVGGAAQCPSCFRKFKSTSALVSHCESGGRRCAIRKSANYNQVMRELTGGLIGTDGFLGDGGVRYTANKVEDW